MYSWNVWNCKGVWDDSKSGHRRLVDTILRVVDEEGEIIDWNILGVIDSSTRLREPALLEPVFSTAPPTEPDNAGE